jgi:hypothetical protein
MPFTGHWHVVGLVETFSSSRGRDSANQDTCVNCRRFRIHCQPPLPLNFPPTLRALLIDPEPQTPSPKNCLHRCVAVRPESEATKRKPEAKERESGSEQRQMLHLRYS